MLPNATLKWISGRCNSVVRVSYKTRDIGERGKKESIAFREGAATW
jgi:hypothetical protein